MSALTEFLFPAPAPRSAGAIVRWWERRRLAYNVFVGGAGLFSLGMATLFSVIPPAPHPLGFPPMMGILAFGILANACYLLGPTAEIFFSKLFGNQVLPTGPTLYRMGLTFSVGLALLPTLIVLIDWVFRAVRAIA